MIYEVTVGARVLRVAVERRRGGGYSVSVDGGPDRTVDVARLGAAEWLLREDGRNRAMSLALHGDGGVAQVGGCGTTFRIVDPRDQALDLGGGAAGGEVISPIPGAVARVLVEVGTRVETGQVVVVVEAMKMENEFKAPCTGLVEAVAVRAGQPVEAGALLVRVLAEEAEG